MNRVLSVAVLFTTLFGIGFANRSDANDRYGHGGGAYYHDGHAGYGASSHRIPSPGYHNRGGYGYETGYGSGYGHGYQSLPYQSQRFVPQPTYPSPYVQQYPSYGNGYRHQQVDHHRVHIDVGPLHLGLGH